MSSYRRCFKMMRVLLRRQPSDLSKLKLGPRKQSDLSSEGHWFRPWRVPDPGSKYLGTAALRPPASPDRRFPQPAPLLGFPSTTPSAARIDRGERGGARGSEGERGEGGSASTSPFFEADVVPHALSREAPSSLYDADPKPPETKGTELQYRDAAPSVRSIISLLSPQLFPCPMNRVIGQGNN